jgi:hypothetical protein
MDKILELREKRNKAWEATKAFVETKKDKDGLLSEEDAKVYAEMEDKVKGTSKKPPKNRKNEIIELPINQGTLHETI